MIAILPVRFRGTPASAVWSDAHFDNWMHRLIPFSLGNYWWESLWGMADLTYELFDDIEIADPRAQPIREERGKLKDGVFLAATSRFEIDWNRFDQALLWFAQAADVFGDPAHDVRLPTGEVKTIGVACVERFTSFDTVCHEVGHAFGLSHELAINGSDYGSPYSTMSARNYGGFFPRSLRPGDPRLNDGTPPTGVGLWPQRLVGPILAAAQLYKYDWFRNSSRVVHVPSNFAVSDSLIQLYALDHARGHSQSAPGLPVLAVIQPPGNRTYTVELRRRTTSFDERIGCGAIGAPPAGLAVHSLDDAGQVSYEGVLAIQPPGGRGWVSRDGSFVLRLESVDPELQQVRFTVTSPRGQQHVFYRGGTGAVDHIFWDEATSSLYADDWTARANAPSCAGTPAAMAWGKQQHVFYRGLTGEINHIFWDPAFADPVFDDWTAKAGGAPWAASDPSALSWPGQQHVFYRGATGAIHHLFWDQTSNKVIADDWTGRSGALLAADAPAVMPWPDQQHVFYVTERGSIGHIFWVPGAAAPVFDDWSVKSGATLPAVGVPAPLAWPGQQHVFYRAANGSIGHVFWNAPTNTVFFDDWTARSAAPAAVGRLAALSSHDQQHVFYRTVAGTIAHIFWGPGMEHPVWDDWTTASGSLLAVGDPSTMAWPNQQHVFHRAAGGVLQHIFWGGTFRRDEWTGAAPQGFSDIATLAIS